jgi:hypothetical protein
MLPPPSPPVAAQIQDSSQLLAVLEAGRQLPNAEACGPAALPPLRAAAPLPLGPALPS